VGDDYSIERVYRMSWYLWVTAKDKDQRGRQHDTVPHQHAPAQAGRGAEINKETEPKNVGPGSLEGK
jgi:hypothetical protein